MTIGTALSAAAAKGYILAGLFSCDVAPPPQIEITFNNKPTIVTHNLSSAELEKFNLATTSSKGPTEIFVRKGVTVGSTSWNIVANFNKLEDPETKQICLSTNKVIIEYKYEPTVHISADQQNGSCEYQQTWLHELKHVNTDILTIKELIPTLKNDMQRFASTIVTVGPFPIKELDEHKNIIGNKIMDAWNETNKKTTNTRLARQQAIDTRQEYLRISKACIGKK